MSAIAASPAVSVPALRRVFAERFLLGLGVFLSGFVIDEPAPYEVYMAVLIALAAILGLLRVSRGTAPLLLMLLAFNTGGLISLTQMGDLKSTPLYIAVSTFLALSAVFFAIAVEADWRRLGTIFDAYVFAAVITALLGILGYFNAFPGSHVFTLYDRAKGVFQDPNVFAPYLTLPGAWLTYRLLADPLRGSFFRIVGLAILTLGVFLSFSRAGWGLYAFAILGTVAVMLLKERSSAFRLRIAILAAAGLVAMVLVVLVALQSEQVSKLFFERAQLVQSYDGARLGRFARHILGFQLAMEHPLGIGPLAFGPLYGEDTHNMWLKALLDYSWLGFASWMTFVITTLALGLKVLLRDRPWQPFLAVAWVVFLGHVAIGNVIDTDHWRHLYLVAGVVWGCVALERRHQVARRGRMATAPSQALHAGR